MSNQKLISVRVDPDALEVIDQYCAGYPCCHRSPYINAAVRLMAWLIVNGKADSVLGFRPRCGDVVDKFEFEYHRERR